MSEQAVSFECAGEGCLGILHGTNGPSGVGMLVVVGGPQYRVGSHRQFVHLARHVAGKGYPVFRFDYRGMGDSSGEQRDFRDVSGDIRAALDAFVDAVPGLESVVIFGLCDAASAALMYGSTDDRVCGLLLANPWVRTEAGLARVHVKHYYLSRLTQGMFWRKLFSGRFRLLASAKSLLRTLNITLRAERGPPTNPGKVHFVEKMRVGLEKFTHPTLVLISGRDQTAQEFVNMCDSRPEWGRLLQHTRITLCRNASADHTFSTRASADWVNEACVTWLAGIAPVR